MKSLLSGAFWGLLSGGVVVGIASLAGPQPAGNAPPAAPLTQAPEAVAETPAVTETLPDSADVSEPEVADATPGALSPVGDAALPLADTTPLDVPDVQNVETALVAPEVTTLPEIETAEADPVLPNPQSVAPQIPVTEDDLVVSTEPAPAPIEDPAPVVVADEPENVVVTEEVALPEEEVIVSEAPEVTAEDSPVLQAPQTSEVDVDVAPEVEVSETVTTAPPALEAPTEEDAGPVLAQAPVEPDADAPVVTNIIENNRASSMPTGAEGIVVNRVRGQSEAEETEVEPAAEADPDAPAIERYAAEFDNADDKPTMSLVVLDDGTLQESAAAIAQLPFPVTVVLDPTSSGATEALAAYRAAGIEVAVLAKIPAGARPADVEVALEAAFATLPETVVMVDTGEGNQLGNRDVMAQAVAALADDGRGLVTVSSGLNTGVRAATEAGVPAGLIFRDLDGEGQDARVIRRFLDQAAFRARQQDGVILLARLRAETLTALMQWGEANRAGQVAVAPISALLSEE